MFLKKQFRLTWKDINFLLSKRNTKHSRFFSCIRYSQYPNNKYNQYSVNIWLKYSKSAVKRRLLKREILWIIRMIIPIEKSIRWKYYKIFFHLNKNNLETVCDMYLKKNQKVDYLNNRKLIIKDLESLIWAF